ncbi:MAG: ferredoxin--NADP(+) reductase [Enterobacteriaceae bacterium]
MSEWVTGTIKEVKHWTSTLFSLQLTAPVTPFVAGQFAKLALTIDGEKVQRAYSYVNAPSQSLLEFYLIAIPEGKLSPQLAQLQPGDSVQITTAAAGFFVLDEVPDCQTLWMLATGTALGPYLSILQEGVGLERFQHIVLVHAARYAQDLSYLPLMEQLQQKLGDKLRIVTVVSREQAEGCLHGRIPGLISSGALEQAAGLPLSVECSHVMLCGNPEMVKETQLLLTEEKAMRKHLRRKPGHITSERYW